MSIRKKIEMSRYAKEQLENLYSLHRDLIFLSFVLFCCLSLMFAAVMDIDIDSLPGSTIWKTFAYSAGLALTSWLLIGSQRFIKGRKKILNANILDHEQTQEITALLKRMENVSVADYPVLEEELAPEQAWRPYRIEHFVAESSRSQMSGTFSGFVSLFSVSGSTQGNSIGKSVPNILDSSSIVFLTDGEQTLRVLIPSPEAMKELITRHMETCVRDKKGTFAEEMVRQYAFDDTKLRMGLTAPHAIDELDVSLESPIDARPSVRICGQLLQPGVVLGTQLQINDKKMLLLPSGFLKEFSEKTQGLMETKKAPILLPEAIGG